jgi:hypothetical protein
LLPQYSDFETGTMAALRATKHSKAKASPARNANAFFLTASYMRLIIPVFNVNMSVIY